MAKGIRSIWIDSDTPESLGNKVIKDDVEIATVPNGVQEYKDPDVVVNREYKYVIQSYTATGQSTDEVLGVNLNYYTIVEATGLKPIMTRFRVESGQPSRVYFDTPNGEPVGLSTQGFTISGNTVTGLDTSAKYFSVGTPFTYWDNNTIRLESGDGTVFDFTLQYITNNIVEPDANNFKFVSLTGDDNNNGDSEAQAWRTLSHAADTAIAGQTVWIKAGNYGRDLMTHNNSGNPTSPIKFIGYIDDYTANNGKGDIDGNYWSYVKNVGLDSTEMPMIVCEIGSPYGRGIQVQAKDNLIFRNMQVEGGYYSIEFRHASDENVGCKNIVVDNCNVYKGGDAGFDSALSANEKIRFTNSICINTTVTNFNVIGQHCLTKDCESWGDNAYADTSDYAFAMGGSNSIAINLEGGLKEDAQSVGHGMTIKGNGVTSEYNLAQDVNVYNCYLAIECKHHESKYNVMRNVNALDTLSGSIPLGGINCSNGASYNTFESCYVQRPDRSTYYGEGVEDPGNTDRGNNNLFLNCIFDQLLSVLYDAGGGSMETFENKYIGCTFIGRSGSTSRVCWDTSGTRDNSFIQCYFEDINNETLNGNTDAINYTNCNFSSIGFTPTDATGSKTVDMNLDANFKPQASFDSFKVAYDSRNKYDYNNLERASDFTTPCAVKSDEE